MFEFALIDLESIFGLESSTAYRILRQQAGNVGKTLELAMRMS